MWLLLKVKQLEKKKNKIQKKIARQGQQGRPQSEVRAEQNSKENSKAIPSEYRVRHGNVGAHKIQKKIASIG